MSILHAKIGLKKQCSLNPSEGIASSNSFLVVASLEIKVKISIGCDERLLNGGENSMVILST
jgi:hypothetical protein